MNEYFKNTCSICDRIYSSPKSLRQHVKKIHPPEDSSGNAYKCFQCDRSLSNCYSLKRHVESVHPPDEHNPRYHNRSCTIGSGKKKMKKCPICEFKASSKQLILSHFKHKHGIDVKTKELQFESFEKFKEWKSTLESETYSWYVRNSTKCRQICEKTYYYCHRSGEYKTQGNGLRKLKFQGSKKINGYCPAGIFVLKLNSGECNVVLTETHVGHDNEIEHVLLSQSERDLLERKVASKVPFEEILNEIRSKRGNKPKRFDLVMKKDLFNIRDRLKAKSGKLDGSDEDMGAYQDSVILPEPEQFSKILRTEESKSSITDGKESVGKELNVKMTVEHKEKLNDYSSNYDKIADIFINGIYEKHLKTQQNDDSRLNSEVPAEPSSLSMEESFETEKVENYDNSSGINSFDDICEEDNSALNSLANSISIEETLHNNLKELLDTNMNEINNEPSLNNNSKEMLDFNLITNILENNNIDTDSIFNEMNEKILTETNLILNDLNSLEEEKKVVLEKFSKQLLNVNSVSKLNIIKTIVDSLTFILDASEKSSCLDFSIEL